MVTKEESGTDEEIIRLYNEGNHDEFNTLVTRYTAPLFNFTARLTSKNDAADIVQETFIKAWKNIHRFNGDKASFKTWIFTIAKNTTTDFLRKKKSIQFADMEKETEENVTSFAETITDENILPDSAMQKLQDAQFLNKTLEKLSPTYREVLVLHYQEEMTFEEIGRILDKPLNTVKSQHRRALLELRKWLDTTAPN